MDYPIKETPTWAEKQTYGPQLSYDQVADIIADVDNDPNLGWRHIHFIATMWAESRFYAWSRPLVWKEKVKGQPRDKAHLSIDRGICAFNSYWWNHVTDREAYDPESAIKIAITWLEAESIKGTAGSKPWDWKPLLDWQWHGYGTKDYQDAITESRAAVNRIHSAAGLPAI